jgi:archaetidylinositol phosphate synthase
MGACPATLLKYKRKARCGMTESGIEKHTRVNDILFGSIERRALVWLCERLPAWVTPDLLTLLALAAGVLIAVSYTCTGYSKNFLWLASLGLVLHWFGDSLDGSLARHRKIERPRYGYFVDHSLDTLVELIVGIGIGLSPLVRMDCALFGVCAYLAMSVSVNIRTCVTGVFQISYCKFGPTELRVLIIILNTVFYFVDNPVVGHLRGDITVCDVLVVVIGGALMLFFIFSTLTVALKLRRDEGKLND